MESQVTRTRSPDPEQVVSRFWLALGKHAAANGWGTARELWGHSNRTFILGTEARKFASLRSSAKANTGFWGISTEKAEELERGETQFLVLLTGPFSGYAIPSARFRRILPEFSRDVKSIQYKINEGKLRQQHQFRTHPEAVGIPGVAKLVLGYETG
jgi:hypothetical protein